MPRPRLRDLGIAIGQFPTGPLNAITDVAEVAVGQTTLIRDEPRIARTGVTIIRPRAGLIHKDLCFAGFHALNGFGEVTGMAWVEESGLLSSPIAPTNSNQGGLVHEALAEYAITRFAGAS